MNFQYLCTALKNSTYSKISNHYRYNRLEHWEYAQLLDFLQQSGIHYPIIGVILLYCAVTAQ